jgi:hypothetical protein
MMGKNVLKWIAGAALAVAALPAIGQARSRYTGTTPASARLMSLSATAKTPLAAHKKHKKTLHKKTSALHKKHTTLHAKHKSLHKTGSSHVKLHGHKHAHQNLSTKKA